METKTRAQTLQRVPGDYAPSEGEQKMREIRTPSEGEQKMREIRTPSEGGKVTREY